MKFAYIVFMSQLDYQGKPTVESMVIALDVDRARKWITDNSGLDTSDLEADQKIWDEEKDIEYWYEICDVLPQEE